MLSKVMADAPDTPKEKTALEGPVPPAMAGTSGSREIALSVRGLSKSYILSHGEVRFNSVAETLLHKLRHPFHRVEKEVFLALDDLSFDVYRGDVVGVIGRNGAGKSTLLKVLSRITPPSKGEAHLYGRVGSLLEVGTGFHPELTGRENIYLNGSILGMSRREIERQFDAIVEFAEIGPFLDTPVKRYSSGMYVRLAFAVAAHLNPEILIVDEVLAVGDAEFQKRCLGKMRDVAKSGRTVLFVSHNMAAIRTLCNRAVLLHQGRLVCDDTVENCIRTYAANSHFHYESCWERTEQAVDQALSIQSVKVHLEGEQPNHFLNVEMKLQSHEEHRPAYCVIEIHDTSGSTLMQPVPRPEGFMRSDTPYHCCRMRVELPPLIPGQYSVTAFAIVHNTEVLDTVRECAGFEIQHSPTSGRTYPHDPTHGYIVPHSTVEYLPNW